MMCELLLLSDHTHPSILKPSILRQADVQSADLIRESQEQDAVLQLSCVRAMQIVDTIHADAAAQTDRECERTLMLQASQEGTPQ